MNEADIYMTPAEVGRYLGLNQYETKELAWKKRLETVLVAGRTHFYRSEVELYKDRLDAQPKAA